jgi:hypothetical protein
VVAHLFHLIEKELGGGIHGTVDVLLEASEMVVTEIQPGNNRIEVRCKSNSGLEPATTNRTHRQHTDTRLRKEA